MLMTLVLYLGLLCGAAEVQQTTGQPAGKEVAALVSQLSGSASLTQPTRAHLQLFDWVPAGATVSVPRGSTVTLVLSSGSRFELEGPARATVTGTALSAQSGAIRALGAGPRLPRIAAITSHHQEGRTAAAVRVRGPRIAHLYPSDGAVTRAGSTVFTFDLVDGASQYALEVEDASGTRVFQVQTAETRVAMPAPLSPGSRYYWRVRTVGSVGAQSRGEAEFRTLAAPDEQARDALSDAMGASADPHALALLAHIDHALGLRREAREGVRAALANAPGDPALRAALRQLAARLERF